MMAYLVVFVGAGLGGAVRHGMNIWVARLLGTHFPWHTFLINILGSLVMGLITGWFVERHGSVAHVRLFLATGVMGGFTTFSAFAVETIALPRHMAAVYIALSVAGSLAACAAGMQLAR